MIWLILIANQNSVSCGLSSMHCTSTLTIKEKNAFKNLNGITEVQASKMDLGGHCGCGFRYTPISLRISIF